MSHNRVHATLSIFSPELSASITEKIRKDGKFTTVTDNLPGEIASSSLALLCLDANYPLDGTENIPGLGVTHIGILKKGQRVATSQVRLKCTDIISVPFTSLISLIALLPKKLQKQGEKSFSVGYKAIPSKTGAELLKAVLASLLELPRSSLDEINAGIIKKCTARKGEVTANLDTAQALFEYAEKNNFPAAEYEFLPYLIGFNAKARFWHNFYFVRDGKPVICFIDPRKSGLSELGRNFAFSIMHHHIASTEDFAEAEFQILSVGKIGSTGKRIVEAYEFDKAQLLPREVLEAGITEAYSILRELENERNEERKAKASLAMAAGGFGF